MVVAEVPGEDGEEVLVPQEEQFATLKEMILHMVEQELEFIVSTHTNPQTTEDGRTSTDWNIKEISESVHTIFSLTEADRAEITKLASFDGGKLDEVEARERLVMFLMDKARAEYEKIVQQVHVQAGQETDAKNIMISLERSILLRSIDTLWVEHLVASDHLRTGIGLRGYGQRDPLVEYKKEMYFLFNQLLTDIQKEVVYSFFKVGIGIQIAPSIMATDKLTLEGAKKESDGGASTSVQTAEQKANKNIGRNDPCHCGSGRKFKKCHGR
jgi:preprotein translocase subunit SecA